MRFSPKHCNENTESLRRLICLRLSTARGWRQNEKATISWRLFLEFMYLTVMTQGGNKSFFPWLPSDVTSDMQRLYVLQWKSGGCLGLRPGQCHCEPASNSRMKQESCLAGRISNCAGEIGRLTVQCLKSSHIVGAFSGSWKGPTLKLESRRGRRRKNGSRLWRKRSRLKIRKAGNCCCQDG